MFDPDREKGPTAMARVWEDAVVRLTTERDAASLEDRKAISKRLSDARRMVRFCKTRAGYQANSD